MFAIALDFVSGLPVLRLSGPLVYDDGPDALHVTVRDLLASGHQRLACDLSRPTPTVTALLRALHLDTSFEIAVDDRDAAARLVALPA